MLISIVVTEHDDAFMTRGLIC